MDLNVPNGMSLKLLSSVGLLESSATTIHDDLRVLAYFHQNIHRFFLYKQALTCGHNQLYFSSIFTIVEEELIFNAYLNMILTAKNSNTCM